ncbi:MAG: hypothetical protein ABEH81_04025 [Halopenitus sp.]
MSSEVDWVLHTIKTNWPGSFPNDLTRVDRDDSELLEDDIREREGELQKSNFVGATHADEDTEPTGSEYNSKLETVVGIRIEGLHVDEWGNVDPTGTDGITWETLKNNIRRGILQERSFPPVGAPNRDYHTLLVTNQADQSDDYRDFYRYDFDVVLDGYETLP